jgi:sulfatase maturation enzyme AslB (radical SAM superfamily)
MPNQFLSVILTAQCNLRCSYCYQNAQSARKAEWATVQSGIDLAFGDGSAPVELMFLGGEPLLEFDLLRRAVSHAKSLDLGGKYFHFSISTNGTLISDAVADYLDEHEFNVQLSFDGVQSAQDYRGLGTFKTLDHVLDSLRAHHALLFRDRLRIAVTLVPETVSFLPKSIQYLFEKDVREITINSCIAPHPGWQSDKIQEVDEAFALVAELSRNHMEQTGAIPVTVLRKANDEIPERNGKTPLCNGLTGKTLALDLDGQIYTCPLFAKSYQKFPSGSLMEKTSILKFGHINDPETRRRTALSKLSGLKILRASLNQCGSSYGICSECNLRVRCSVCPVSVWQTSNVSGPYRVPDFVCAFNRVALKHRDCFPSVTEAMKRFLPKPAVNDPIRQFEEYLRAKQTRSI